MERKNILFFDDEPFITKILIDNLQKNYEWNKDNLGEITFVSTPNELFDEVNSTIKYDLFVMDIMVPIVVLMMCLLVIQITENYLASVLFHLTEPQLNKITLLR